MRKLGCVFALMSAHFMGHANSGVMSSEDTFSKYTVSGAQCGDGSPYSYFIREGDPARVLVHFQGGGACWDAATCHGPVALTSLKSSGMPSKNGYFTKRFHKEHPFENYTYVFLPYCNGDIWLGTHEANYLGQRVLHHGRRNVEKVVALLESRHRRLISLAKKITLYGESAGAIGAMLNVDLFSNLLAPSSDKSMVLDSPGLHFSASIWARFSKPYLNDIAEGMNRSAMKLSKYSGIIAKQVKTYCQAQADWKIGVIQSTSDLVMSSGFGMRTPAGHKQIVKSYSGIIYRLRDDADACSSWVPDSTRHVWARDYAGWTSKTSDGKMLKTYIEGLVNGRLSDRFPSHQ